MFEWDEAKNASNVLKHKVYFADTFAVFEDSNSLTIDDFESGEQRFITIGMDAFGRVLVVVCTWRGEKIRIISARKAVRHEVKQYESQI